MRRAAGEWLVRLLLFCAAMGLLRWGHVAFQAWQKRFGSTFVYEWDGWAGWIALVAAAGFTIGLALLPGRPRRYRVVVPLATTLPALVLLGHFVLVLESADADGSSLPWILDHYMFYMDLPSQFVLATVAGLGLAGGLDARPDDAVSSTSGKGSPSEG